MSYDIQIKFKDNIVDTQVARNFINSLPYTENSRFVIDPDYYMEIDLEDIQADMATGDTKNCISFHVPYVFMDKHHVDHDVYFNYINKIAEHFGGRAYDLQMEMFLDSPEYNKVKRRMLTPNLSYWGVIERIENVLRFSDKHKECLAFRVDLNNFTLHYEAKSTPAEPRVYEDFQQYRAYRSNDNSLVAVTNWKEKSVKIFPGSKYAHDNETLKALWSEACDTVIEKCGQVVSISFTADDKKILTGAYRNHILKLWDIKTGKLICNFTCYARSINTYLAVNERLICICSKSVISFFDYTNGKNIVNISPLDNNWLVFNANGDHEFKTDVNGAIELDWIDNDKNETYSFIPGLGFAYYERWGSFKLNKLQETTGTRRQGLLRTMLEGYV